MPSKRERAEEGDSSFPGGHHTSFNKRRRLSPQDTDHGHKHRNDEAQFSNDTEEGKTTASNESPELSAPTLAPSSISDLATSNDDIDAILDDEANADDEEDEVGDDLVIPGPDGDDEDDGIPIGTVPPQHPLPHQASIRRNSYFSKVLRDLITQMKDWAVRNPYKSGGDHLSQEMAMTWGFWNLLRKVSVDYLLELFIPAIPLEVQDLFEKSTWGLLDFFSLPSAAEDDRQGIYCDFATANVAGDITLQGECDAYVGSTRCLKKRISQHLAIARKYPVTRLPARYQRSFHYRQICRRDVQANFRKLACFDAPIHTGYLSLLEGIFMILLRTYRDPGYCWHYSTAKSYRLTSATRIYLNLPMISWQGMNAAWPLCQGFINYAAGSESKCRNQDCDAMTFPKSKRPDGAPKRHRSCADPGNPLGGYYCGTCNRFLARGKPLPSASTLARIAQRREVSGQRREARAEAGADAVCGTCRRLESQCATFNVKQNGKVTTYMRRHLLHPVLGKLVCEPCRSFFNRNKRERTELEVQNFLNGCALFFARQKGESIRCENPICGAIEGSPTCINRHSANGHTRKILCFTCTKHAKKHRGELRSAANVQAYVARKRAKKD